MPSALSIDVPYELFWHLNPTKLKPFFKAFENKRKMRDEEQWMYWGTYGMSALSTIVAHAFSKGSQAKYIEEPLFKKLESNKEITEEEKRIKTEQLFMQLQIMQINFESTHNKNK